MDIPEGGSQYNRDPKEHGRKEARIPEGGAILEADYHTMSQKLHDIWSIKPTKSSQKTSNMSSCFKVKEYLKFSKPRIVFFFFYHF